MATVVARGCAIYRASILAVAITTIGFPVHAQNPSERIQDIVVTARRQAESLQQTPVAVTALDATAIERMNIIETDRIADIAPNLAISQQPSAMGSASVMIRGIGQTEPAMGGLDMAVGVYLDGVYVARTAGALFDIVAPERIEVLRGPQGTLFGRNTTGGAIQIVSQKPSDNLSLMAKGGYGSRNSWFLKGRFDTGAMGQSPISAAFTFQHRQKEGYFDNYNTSSLHDPGSLIANSFRTQLRGDFQDLQINYSFDYDKRKGAPPYVQLVALSPDAEKYYGSSASLGGNPLQYHPKTRLKEGYLGAAPSVPGGAPYLSETESWGHNLTVSYELSEAVRILSITGYRGMEMNNVEPHSGNGGLVGVVLDPETFAPSIQPVTPFNGYNGPQVQKQFSQELQLSGTAGDFSYVSGLYYFWERGGEDHHQQFTYILPGGDAALNLEPFQSYRVSSYSYAAYGQVSYKPSALDRKLELTAGIRYTRDKKKIELRNTAFGQSTVIGPSQGETRFSNTSFLGSLSYSFTDTIMAYAKVATGYKSGGFNPRIDMINLFRPEKLVSAEAGFKGDFLDRHLRTNLALYWSRYKDLQIPQFAPGTGGTTQLIVNAGRATFRGAEAEIIVAPLPRLTISGTLGYNHAKYNEFLFRDPSSDLVVDIASAAHFLVSPKLTTNLSVDYALPTMRFGQIAAHISWAHRSRVFFHANDAVSPFNHQTSSPAQDSLSARIMLSDIPLSSGQMTGEIALTGENLLNQDQVAYGMDFGGLGFGGIMYREPRRLGIEFKVNY